MAEARFSLLAEVTLRAEPQTSGRIFELELRNDGEYYYRVFIEANRQPWYSEGDLVQKATERDPLIRAEKDLWGTAGSFLTYLTLKKLRNPLTDVLYSYQASRTDLYPHQFIPLLKVLDSPHQRILIADEVGLGKTIEAGLIMAEQKSRGHLKRVLIVCQGALLIGKWVREMRHRFDEPFEALTSERLAQFLNDYEQNRDPELRAVASLPLLRRDEWRERLQDLRVHFDLTVVDEAHRLKNSQSVSFELGEVLAEHSDMLIFLTATPLHLKNDDLFSLLHLLDPSRFPTMAHLQGLLRPQELINRCVSLLRSEASVTEIREAFQQLERLRDITWLRQDPVMQQVSSRLGGSVLSHEDRLDVEGMLLSLSPLAHVFTRTRRADLNMRFAQRTPVRVEVALGELEQEFMHQAEALAREVYRSTDSTFGAGLASITLRRQAASSLPATLQYLRDVLAQTFTLAELEEALPDLDLPEKMPTSFQLDPRLHSRVQEMLGQFSSMAENDTKWVEFQRCLQQQIQEGQQKFVLFSFFKRTLAYLDRRLRHDGFSTHLLTGDVAAEDREAVVDRFREDPLASVLLSSEVGGEGLDFQFAAVMFNYDMPWNPMVVEQRIGRIDRIGQQSERIIIFNFSVVGTIEEIIYERLYDRIELFRRSIGDLEAILGEQLSQLTQDILKYKLTPEEAAEKARKLADALLREERTLKSLENEDARISGNDSYFLQRIGEVRTGKRFLQPQELERFVSTGLELWHPGSRLQKVARRPDVLRISEVKELWPILASRAGRSRALRPLLQQLHSLHHHPEVTFHSQVAQGDRNLSLITSRHPLVELLKQDPCWEDAATDQLSATGAFLCPGLPPQEFLVFFFLLSYAGFRRSLMLSAIPVSLPEVAVRDDLEEAVLSGLGDGRLTDWQDAGRVGTLVVRAREAATSAVVKQKRLRETELSVEAERLVAMRQNSLQITFEKRRHGLRRKLETATHENIVRMYTSNLERVERDYRADLAELEERKKVYCQEELMGVAYCRGLGEA